MKKSNIAKQNKLTPANRLKRIDKLKKQLDAAVRRLTILGRVNKFLSRYNDQPHLYIYFSKRLDVLLKSRKFQDMILNSERWK